MGDTVNKVAQSILKGRVQVQFAGMDNRRTGRPGAVQLESQLPEKLYLGNSTFFDAA